ncbi:hypothetical protein [Sinomicrobium sp. M5D2P9]
MNWWEIGKGLLCFLAAFIYFKYLYGSLAKEGEKKFGSSYTRVFFLADKMRDIKGLIVGILLIVFGLFFIYNELARNYGWELIMAKE